MSRVAFIFEGGIKPSSESQPELARQHVVKQKPAGRRAWRRRAAFICACWCYVTLQTKLNRSVCESTTREVSGVLIPPHLTDHSVCNGNNVRCHQQGR